MDRRSWPWKKRSSEKAVIITDSSHVTSYSDRNQAEQNADNIIDYVQISMESYTHLTEMEEQVKILNEKLFSAQTEMTTKDNLVKQHAKVAEEAVSGWEKAEAETLALKQQLESITLLKLTAEKHASHLDGALKECMKQIRSVKEESEQRLHDVVFAKTKQWEKVKADLEIKLADFEEELLRASAENAALSRSLQDHSAILLKVSDEKMQADTEIEVLKNNTQSCEQEIKSLKYELHVISKELEIRNEEKNMSIRSADVATKQHLEDVKKISKLEAECQRLRGLVRKKLPGPAALAQMKQEVENLGRNYGDTRFPHSPAKNPGAHHMSAAAPEFASESIYTLQKENEFLTTSLLTIEKETKMLKESLSKRNSELQAARDMCAKQASKLCSLEAQMSILKQQKFLSRPSIGISSDTTLSQNESNPSSLTSTSEDGIYEEGRSSTSWASTLMSECSQFKKEKIAEKFKSADDSNYLELMDDFLEMERLAHLSTGSHGPITISDDVTKTASATLVGDDWKNDTSKRQQLVSEKLENLPCTDQVHSEGLLTNKLDSPLFKLQTRIASTFKLQGQEVDIGKILEDIRCILQDVQNELPQKSVSCVTEEHYSVKSSSDRVISNDDIDETTNIDIYYEQDNISCANGKHALSQELKNAISEIEDFVLFLWKEATELKDRISGNQGLSEKVKQFSSCIKDVLHNEKCLNGFIIFLSEILSEASKMGLKISFDVDECENNIVDCIDKVTLLENRVAQDQGRNDNFSALSTSSSHSPSHPEIEGPLSDNFVQRNTTQKFSFKELEQLRLEKENMQRKLSTCTELLEETKLQLTETEHNLTELESQLATSKRSNSLFETQLKCMAESYNLLELRTKELETEVNMLHVEVQTLNNELQEERHTHQEDLIKSRDIQEQIKNKDKSANGPDADSDSKAKQEKEIADAAEKLAECQENILILGRQLQAMRPPAESSPNNRNTVFNRHFEDSPRPSSYTYNAHGLHKSTLSLCDAEIGSAFVTTNEGDSPLDGYDFQICTSDTEAATLPRSAIHSKHQKRRSSRSSSSTAFPNASEKHGRSFSWFFSKGKGDH
ncbi:hypothetical protein Cni_G16044 [Canna indica]|uniref:Filament-like plant protein 4 n=1 Tax=Canna indica TaxID=4628 RepID=A0AAQ3QDV9_9LILI|nr:hypothetical protein Cni_G16044 [Canna indica]